MKTIIIAVLKAYKKLVSPMLPQACRFYPTCSQYCIDSVEKHGAAKGLLRGLWRVLRCSQFSKGGFDPVR